MKIARIRNSLFVIFLCFCVDVFSQNKIYESNDLPDDWNDYRIFYKTDKQSKLKIFMRVFLVENEKKQDDFEKCDRVIQFLKKDNPFLACDFKIVRECIGFNSSHLSKIKTLSKDKYLYLKLYYHSPRPNGDLFIFEKNELGLYHLIRQQEVYSNSYKEVNIRWYKGIL